MAASTRGLGPNGLTLTERSSTRAGSTPRARSWAALSESELSGAAASSLAENLSDSVVAPLFYYALFGLGGALVFRVVNTLDAMVGYRGRYEWLGKPAARPAKRAARLTNRRAAVSVAVVAGSPSAPST